MHPLLTLALTLSGETLRNLLATPGIAPAARPAMISPRFALLAWVAFAAAPISAQSYAFVSRTDGAFDGLSVIDLNTMTVERTLNVGDEPGRMVANADRSRIYLSSWQSANPSPGLVYAIDTRLRQVVAGPVAVGLKQNRSIGISPNGQRVYTWKLESVDSVIRIGVAVLDAMSLAEITTVPLSGPGCTQGASDIAVAPDGRIVAMGCSDGLRIIDPVTFAVSIGGLPTLPSGSILGFSPDGGEVYTRTPGPVQSTTGLRAIDLATGVSNNFFWNLATGGSSAMSDDAFPLRMTVVQRPSDPPNDPTVFIGYFSSSSPNVPVAWARASDLVARQRRLVGRAALGITAQIGFSMDGAVGLGARLGAVRRLLSTDVGAVPIAPSGSALALPGISNLTDIIVVPNVPDFLFRNGFEVVL